MNSHILNFLDFSGLKYNLSLNPTFDQQKKIFPIYISMKIIF